MPSRESPFKDFPAGWTLVVDPAKVQFILTSINLPPKTIVKFNQLMVAYDQSGIAYYSVYGSGGHKDKETGKPVHDLGTPFDQLYDRGDMPAALDPQGT